MKTVESDKGGITSGVWNRFWGVQTDPNNSDFIFLPVLNTRRNQQLSVSRRQLQESAADLGETLKDPG